MMMMMTATATARDDDDDGGKKSSSSFPSRKKHHSSKRGKRMGGSSTSHRAGRGGTVGSVFLALDSVICKEVMIFNAFSKEYCIRGCVLSYLVQYAV